MINILYVLKSTKISAWMGSDSDFLVSWMSLSEPHIIARLYCTYVCFFNRPPTRSLKERYTHFTRIKLVLQDCVWSKISYSQTAALAWWRSVVKILSVRSVHCAWQCSLAFSMVHTRPLDEWQAHGEQITPAKWPAYVWLYIVRLYYAVSSCNLNECPVSYYSEDVHLCSDLDSWRSDRSRARQLRKTEWGNKQGIFFPKPLAPILKGGFLPATGVCLGGVMGPTQCCLNRM